MEGVIGIKPEIKQIFFPKRGNIGFNLMDGRMVVVPLSFFPSIKKLSTNERKKWQVIDNDMFTFKNSTEIFHIEQVLGKEKEYKYPIIH